MAKKHQRLQRIIQAGDGGHFRGVQRVPALGFQNQRNYSPAYLLVYFDSIRTGTTCTMMVRSITAAKVRQHLIKSNKQFGVAHPEQLTGARKPGKG